MKKILVIIAAILAVILLAFVAINSVAANAISYEEKVTESYSTIKVQEKRRADLLPLLADAIKSYDKHEYETLMKVIAARTASDGTLSDEGVNEINQIINVVKEAYPDLKSNTNYQEFMKEAAITENKIAEARTAYNKAVSRYNTYVRHPIKKIFLNMTGYEVRDFNKLSYNVSEDAPTDLFD